MKVGIQNNGVFIGAMSFPDRKKPCLIVERENQAILLGSFVDEARVEEFGKALEELMGVGGIE